MAYPESLDVFTGTRKTSLQMTGVSPYFFKCADIKRQKET
jgi:hypothetical protein